MRGLARLLNKNQYRKTTFLNTSQKLWVRKSTIYILLQINSLQLYTATRVKLTYVNSEYRKHAAKECILYSHLYKVQNQEKLNNLWLKNTHISGNTIKKNKEKVITKWGYWLSQWGGRECTIRTEVVPAVLFFWLGWPYF